MSLRALTLKSVSRPMKSIAFQNVPTICHMSTSSKTPEPKEKAASIIDSIPGNSVLSKTGILATSTAAAVYAISNELYVINEESILVGTFLGFSIIFGKFIAPLYKDYANDRIKQVSEILNASRNKHVDAVKERIDSVSDLKNVSATTKVLFDVSKETVELEAKAFELKQKVSLAEEAKSVLDSWVRYEASIRKLQQQQITESVISKVQSELENPKFQDKILQQSIVEVEELLAKLK
ncbi:hypothetical protein TPHA_0L01730 [Tetrapisispora phaffii CBS 4417]|uniref:ATP synthase subunit 4 n=1 Tax=Tetrapisispora phaffii (strain ATCC 24235 / CBS 4417 / NBRC 1672 / NRRL Y-8282 / UCD 70-5) TaxID=1071381 RepID=G8C048_TETPH|nr:hypothetical protein TPHA_0L01730 [Tetrapisispora phaffii CBS 4417]CCE65526.1 hypothetical protein TPHA_0L01730 [Tetrapisispora phaffii CBS 4417]